MQSEEKSTILEKLRRLRDLLNRSKQVAPSVWRGRDQGNWSKLWAAFDNLEDTQLAIEEFGKGATGRLGLYGLLQAIAVQQDAMMHVEKSLNLEYTPLTTKADLIRKIRDETVGHPANTRRHNRGAYKDGAITYTSLSAYLGNTAVLEYMVWSAHDNEIKKVNLPEIIHDQSAFLETVIDKVYEQIEQVEAAHREKYRDDKMEPLFNQASYYIQKLFTFESSREYAQINFDFLVKQYETFKEKLKQRYGDDVFQGGIRINGVTHEIEKTDELINRLRRTMLLEADVDRFQHDIFVEALRASMEFLKGCAKEIDEEFAGDSSRDSEEPEQIVEIIIDRGNKDADTI